MAKWGLLQHYAVQNASTSSKYFLYATGGNVFLPRKPVTE